MLDEVPIEMLADKHRRWFRDEQLDLIVWLSDTNNIVGFQLCYRHFQQEHALTWTQDGGFSHDRVDSGDNWPGQSQTPILVADAPFPEDDVAAQFASESRDVDPAIRTFVLDRLAAYAQEMLSQRPAPA